MKNIKQSEKLAVQDNTLDSIAPVADFLTKIEPTAPLKLKHAGGRPKLSDVNKNNDKEIGLIYNDVLVLNTYRSRNFFGKSYIMAECKCNRCGKLFTCRLRALKSGNTKSCGCLKAEMLISYANNKVSTLPEATVDAIGTVYYGPNFNVFKKRKLAGIYHLAYFVIDWAARKWKETNPEEYKKLKDKLKSESGFIDPSKTIDSFLDMYHILRKLTRAGGLFGETQEERKIKRWNSKHPKRKVDCSIIIL